MSGVLATAARMRSACALMRCERGRRPAALPRSRRCRADAVSNAPRSRDEHSCEPGGQNLLESDGFEPSVQIAIPRSHHPLGDSRITENPLVRRADILGDALASAPPKKLGFCAAAWCA